MKFFQLNNSINNSIELTVAIYIRHFDDFLIKFSTQEPTAHNII